ncbi:MAG: hypothetical protein KGK07_07160 [Chloroflexota bacterium]|nr:hypothetical protein [Chloroflexota bacterium]
MRIIEWSRKQTRGTVVRARDGCLWAQYDDGTAAPVEGDANPGDPVLRVAGLWRYQGEQAWRECGPGSPPAEG